MSSKPEQEIRKLFNLRISNKKDVKTLQIKQKRIPPNLQLRCKTWLKQFEGLQILILEQCQLKSLAFLPYLKHLQTLELSFNYIQYQQIDHLMKYKSLLKLCLTENKIKQLEVFQKLAVLNKLEHLYMDGNKVASHKDYREAGFGHLTSLLTLDGCDKKGNPIDQQQDYGQDIILEQSEPDDSGQEMIQDFSEQDEEIDYEDNSIAPVRTTKKR